MTPEAARIRRSLRWSVADGAYFGRRNAIANLATLAATTLTSLFKFVAMPL